MKTAADRDAWALAKISRMLKSGIKSAADADANFDRVGNADHAADWSHLGFRLTQLAEAVGNGLFDQLDKAEDTAADELGMADHRFDDAPAAIPTARAFAVAAYLQAEAPDVRFGSWHLSDSEVSCMFVGHTHDDTARAWLRMVADRFDLRYAEDPFRGDETECMATGTIGGIAVKFHQLVATDRDAPRTAPWASPDVSAKIDAQVRQNLAHAATLQTIPASPATSWAISYTGISAMVRRPHITAARTAMRCIADEHGYAYGEELRPNSGPDAIYVHAARKVDGVEVRFWDIRDEVPAAAEVVDDGLLEEPLVMDVAEYFPDAGSVPTAEELAEGEWMDHAEAVDVARIQHEMDLDAGAECDAETCAFCGVS